MPDEPTKRKSQGAVDLDACPRDGKWHGCGCGVCRICGFTKHKAIHGPIYGQPPGSAPWGHEFEAQS